MPASPRATVLCRYHYDALNRLDNSAPSTTDSLQRFYCKTRLASEIQGSVCSSIFQHDDQLLAQQHHANARIESSLLATDRQRSVITATSATGLQPAAYTPYGHRSPENGLLSLLGFNGERRDPLTGHYHLGNGHRQFNPQSMRFNSPDSLSPFGDGGLNAYAYCVWDPVNKSDPSGRAPVNNLLKFLLGLAAPTAVTTGVAAHFVQDKTTSDVLAAASGISIGLVIGLATRQFMFRNSAPTKVTLSANKPMTATVAIQRIDSKGNRGPINYLVETTPSKPPVNANIPTSASRGPHFNTPGFNSAAWLDEPSEYVSKTQILPRLRRDYPKPSAIRQEV